MDQLNNNTESESESESKRKLLLAITDCEEEIWRLIESLPSNLCDKLVDTKFIIYNLSLNLHTMCMTFYKSYKNEKTNTACGLAINTHEDWMTSKSELEKQLQVSIE